jgi:hypothetical protein
MTRSQQPALTLFAVGMIGLGILALVYGDFALVWQPVAPWIPGRTVLAYASGLIMLLGGVGLLFKSHGGMVGSHPSADNLPMLIVGNLCQSCYDKLAIQIHGKGRRYAYPQRQFNQRS